MNLFAVVHGACKSALGVGFGVEHGLTHPVGLVDPAVKTGVLPAMVETTKTSLVYVVIGYEAEMRDAGQRHGSLRDSPTTPGPDCPTGVVCFVPPCLFALFRCFSFNTAQFDAPRSPRVVITFSRGLRSAPLPAPGPYQVSERTSWWSSESDLIPWRRLRQQ